MSVKPVEVGQVWRRKPGREITSDGCHFFVAGDFQEHGDLTLIPCRNEGGRWVRGAKERSRRNARTTRKGPHGIRRDMVHVADGVTLANA